MIESNKWSQLIVLVLALKKSVLTGFRFNEILERKSRELLFYVHIRFFEKNYHMLSKYNGKIKVITQKKI